MTHVTAVSSRRLVRLPHALLRFRANTTSTTRAITATTIVRAVKPLSNSNDQMKSVWVWTFVFMLPNAKTQRRRATEQQMQTGRAIRRPLK